MRKPKETKRCPRCGVKVPTAAEKCPQCGLIYERLKLTTNKSAKVALAKGQKHKVIEYNVLPPDLSWIRLLLYCLFFGYIGVHRFYVGKIKSGFFFVFSFVAVCIATMIFLVEASILYNLAYIITLPIAFNALFWVMDFFRILFKKFKVPVSIPEDFAVDGEYGGVLDLVRDIDNSVDVSKRKKVRKAVRQEVEQSKLEEAEEAELDDLEIGEEPVKKVVIFDQRTINKGSKSKKKKHKKGKK